MLHCRYINPVMYTDPSGEFPLIALAIFTGIMIVAGGVFGGISAGESGSSIIEGVGLGMLMGGLFAMSVAMIVGGFSIGGTTILGSMMASYGISVTANMLEILVLQSKKSCFDGDSFWSATDDVVNALGANMGRYLLGRIGDQSFGILGSRMVSKLSVLHKFTMTVAELNKLYSFQSAYRIASQSFWKSSSPYGYVLAFAMSAWQVGNLASAIIVSKSYENSRWILY